MFTNQKVLLDKFSDILMLGVKRSDLLFLLIRATKEHKQVEDKFKQMLSQLHCGVNASYPNIKLKTFKYFERNFFSILFLSIFKAAEIPKERRINYGVIINAIRTIVTCTDNILDKEQKGAVFLNLDLNNTVLENVILSLMSQRIVGQAARMVANNEDTADQIEKSLLDSLCSVAKGENLAYANGFDTLPEPNEVIETVHKKIGGELLRLALIAPLKNEVEKHQQLQYMESGILAIGVGLQMLDDVVDFKEDITADRTNLLASWIVHKGRDGSYIYPQLRNKIRNDETNIENVFKLSRTEVINTAIGKALEGFEQCAHGGYPIDTSSAISIIKMMFRLRGLEKEWQISNFA